MRFFYSVCFLVIGMGLPVLAKNAGADKPAPTITPSSKGGSKAIPAPSPAAVAKAKEQAAKPAPVVVKKDEPRNMNTSAPTVADAAPAHASTHAPAPAHVHPDAPAPAPAHLATHDLHSTSSGFVIHSSSTLPAVTAVYESDHGDHMSNREFRTGVALGGPFSGRGSENENSAGNGRLARVTAYWAAEGDYYTERCISSTGVRLHDGHCAVDPNIIPYGSVVEIAGVGKFLAVDTGSAVISRTAAREGGKTDEERRAIVVDLFFEDREAGERFEAAAAKYVTISWWTPSSMGIEAKLARSLFAEEDWTKIQGKQL